MKHLLVTALFLSPFLMRSQAVTVTHGQEFALEKGKYVNTAIDPDSTGFYYLKDAGGYFASTYMIRKFDLKTAALIFEKMIDLSGDAYLGGKGYYLNAFNKNGRIQVFSQATKGRDNMLMMQEYSNTTGEALGTPVVVDDIRDNKATAISTAEITFKISFSPDNKKMMSVLERKDNGKVQKVQVKLFDASNNYKLIWEKEPVSVYFNSTVSSFDYNVDNQGNLYYLFGYLRTKNEGTYYNGSNIVSYQDVAHAIGISPFGTTNNKVIEIPSKGITTNDPKLRYINNYLVCTGQFYEGELKNRHLSENMRTGFFFLTVDPVKGELKNKSFDFFSENMREKLTYKDKGFKTVMASEKVYSPYKTVFLNNNFYVIYLRTVNAEYVGGLSKEVIISKYSTDNKLQWIKIYPRSSKDPLTGVNYLVTKKINLFYYEDPKNLETFPDLNQYDGANYATVTSAKKGVLVCLSIDEQGNATRKKVDIGEVHPVLDENNFLRVEIPSRRAFSVPVDLGSSKRRYDLISVQD